jgi:hypothetical protein
MFPHQWKLPPNLPLCVFSDRLYRTVAESVFAQINEATTPSVFAQLQTNLLELRQQLLQDMPPIHYAAQFGTHICLEDLYEEAKFRLLNLALLYQEEQPTAPEPEPLDPEEVFKNLGNDVDPESDDTYLGTDPDSETNGSNS